MCIASFLVHKSWFKRAVLIFCSFFFLLNKFHNYVATGIQSVGWGYYKTISIRTDKILHGALYIIFNVLEFFSRKLICCLHISGGRRKMERQGQYMY